MIIYLTLFTDGAISHKMFAVEIVTVTEGTVMTTAMDQVRMYSTVLNPMDFLKILIIACTTGNATTMLQCIKLAKNVRLF